MCLHKSLTCCFSSAVEKPAELELHTNHWRIVLNSVGNNGGAAAARQTSAVIYRPGTVSTLEPQLGIAGCSLYPLWRRSQITLAVSNLLSGRSGRGCGIIGVKGFQACT